MDERLSRYAEILTAMSNVKRLEVLLALLEKEWTVTELAVNVGLSQSALSQHLAKLRSAGLVQSRRRAQEQYYSIISPAVVAVLKGLDGSVGGAATHPPPTGGETRFSI